MSIFGGKRYFVYGDGASGRAACTVLRRCGAKARIYSDEGGVFRPPAEREYAGAVISPGIRPDHPVYAYCAECGIPVLAEPDLAELVCPRGIAAGVTGTNGKTTVTRLLAAMTGGVACGNIGYPVCAAAADKRSYAPLVCELSSFQLYSAKVAPHVAVITNIAPDHIDWHGSFENYCECKCNIARRMTGGYLVLGEDIPVGALKTLDTGAEIVRCAQSGGTDGAYVSGGYFCFFGKRVCPVDYLRLAGSHNIKNALCAIAAAKCLNVPDGDIISALSSAVSEPHRQMRLGERAGKQWIDDSKGTNVSACAAAIAATDGSVCLILGGRGKGTDFFPLLKELDGRVTDIVAMGETAQQIRDTAKGCGCPARICVVNGLADAVAAAAKSSAGTVLLSPACASFDEFNSYAERGESFLAEIDRLEKKNGKKQGRG